MVEVIGIALKGPTPVPSSKTQTILGHAQVLQSDGAVGYLTMPRNDQQAIAWVGTQLGIVRWRTPLGLWALPVHLHPVLYPAIQLQATAQGYPHLLNERREPRIDARLPGWVEAAGTWYPVLGVSLSSSAIAFLSTHIWSGHSIEHSHWICQGTMLSHPVRFLPHLSRPWHGAQSETASDTQRHVIVWALPLPPEKWQIWQSYLATQRASIASASWVSQF